MKRSVISITILFISLSLWAQTNDGVDALNAGMYKTAKVFFLNQLTDSLTRPDACYYLGEIYRQTGNTDSAMICFNMGLSAMGTNPLCKIGKGGLLMQSDPAAAALLIKEASSTKNYRKNAVLLVAVARIYVDNQKYDEANALLEQAKEKSKQYTEIYLTEGDMLFKQKKIGEAAGKFETAIYYNTNCKPAYLKIAKIYYQASFYEQSLSYLERLKVIDPHFPPALKLYGDICYDKGKYTEAVTAYAEYLQTPEAVTNDHVRYAYALFFNKEFDKSLAEIKVLIPQNPGNQVLKRILAYNSYETGNYTDGLNQMEEFLKIADPSTIIASDYKYYARLLSKNSLDSLSAVNYQKAMALSRDPREYYKEVALLYEKMKQYNNAADYFGKYIQTAENPANSDIFFWGRNCYFAAGAIDSAIIANDSLQAGVRLKFYEKADSIFAVVNTLSPNNHLGSLWRARVNSILDPDTELGLAKPYYERVIEILTQSGKSNKKELVEAYQYLGYYFYLKNELPDSKMYWKKILEIDPEHAVAKKALEGMK